MLLTERTYDCAKLLNLCLTIPLIVLADLQAPEYRELQDQHQDQECPLDSDGTLWRRQCDGLGCIYRPTP
jgi:hypothetical protein